MIDLLEEIDGWYVGRDPRQLNREELLAAGHKPMSPMQAIRARCLDCCADQPSEVRKCTAVKCPSWPFRMGVNPWRAEPSEARREAARKAGEAAKHARQQKKACAAQTFSDETDLAGTSSIP